MQAVSAIRISYGTQFDFALCSPVWRSMAGIIFSLRNYISEQVYSKDGISFLWLMLQITQTYYLKTTHNYYLTVLCYTILHWAKIKVAGLYSLLEALLCLFQVLEATHVPWLSGPFPPSSRPMTVGWDLPTSYYSDLFCLCLPSLRTLVIPCALIDNPG